MLTNSQIQSSRGQVQFVPLVPSGNVYSQQIPNSTISNLASVSSIDKSMCQDGDVCTLTECRSRRLGTTNYAWFRFRVEKCVITNRKIWTTRWILTNCWTHMQVDIHKQDAMRERSQGHWRTARVCQPTDMPQARRVSGESVCRRMSAVRTIPGSVLKWCLVFITWCF